MNTTLKKLMKQHNLSAVQTAKLAGVSRAQVYKWLSGETMPEYRMDLIVLKLNAADTGDR